MLSRLIFVSILLSNTSHIASRPTGPAREWEVGNSPLSGYDSTSLWNHLAPWSRSGEESPYGAADSPFSPHTWFVTPPIAHPGMFDSPPQHPNDIQPHIVHHQDMSVAVPSVESSFQGFDQAHPTFHAGPSWQEHGPSSVLQHQDFPLAHFQEVPPLKRAVYASYSISSSARDQSREQPATLAKNTQAFRNKCFRGSTFAL